MRLFTSLVLVLSVLIGQNVAWAASGKGARGRQPHEVRTVLVKWKPGFEAKGRGRKLRMPGLFSESLTAADTNATAVAERISKEEGVEYAEPDYDQTTLLTANDPYYASQQWNFPKVSAPAAWDLSTGSPAVKVCVIDTGIDWNHADLGANTMPGYDAINNVAGGLDDNNHGSHCAGVIGAATNNSAGVAGINWRVTMLPCKFLSASGSGSTSDGIECIYWCRDQGATISSNSWGSTSSSLALRDAIAKVGAESGHIFVTAAGNNAANNDGTTSVNYPAAYNLPLQITVASTTNTDALSSFSAYGATTVHLAAPGSNIYSTIKGGSYGLMSGTSMATPHVSAALALMKAANPSLSSAELKSKLLANVDPVDALAGKVSTGGRLNVGKAVAAVAPPATSPPPPSPPPVSPPPVESPPPPVASPSPPPVVVSSPPPPPSVVLSPPPPPPRKAPPPPKKGGGKPKP